MTTTTTHTADQVERFRLATIARADATHATYPQYAGHWTQYRVVRVRRAIRTKLGQAFTKGEWTIATADRGTDFVTAYSLSNRCDTSIRVADVEWL